MPQQHIVKPATYVSKQVCEYVLICTHVRIFPISKYLGIWFRNKAREQRKGRGKGGEEEGKENTEWASVRKK